MIQWLFIPSEKFSAKVPGMGEDVILRLKREDAYILSTERVFRAVNRLHHSGSLSVLQQPKRQ